MKILIVEDESALVEEMTFYLEAQGFLCEGATNLAEAGERLYLYEYDIVILDLMLPDGSGLDLIRAIKERRIETGIIILTAKGSLPDRIEGLDRGADDYLAKPFHLSELNARIHALLRRSIAHGAEVIECGPLRIDTRSMLVRLDETVISLTPREYHLLLYFVINRNRVLGRQAIAEHLLGDMADLADSLDFIYVHVNSLRRKLADAGAPEMIRTLYGTGYQLVEP